ncbi:uncharacterized protein [Chironomus tepperi]|uniref:uncharacterized protein n=1 Tax=Chironomus tepperi TaxID=113505 RepID=UPI00391FC96C
MKVLSVTKDICHHFKLLKDDLGNICGKDNRNSSSLSVMGKDATNLPILRYYSPDDGNEDQMDYLEGKEFECTAECEDNAYYLKPNKCFDSQDDYESVLKICNFSSEVQEQVEKGSIIWIFTPCGICFLVVVGVVVVGVFVFSLLNI